MPNYVSGEIQSLKPETINYTLETATPSLLIMKTIATFILTVVLTCVPFAPFERPEDIARSVVEFNSLQALEPLQSSMVYICTGPESKRYHSNSNCRGLNKCSASIEKVTVAKAKSMKRTACKICYK